MTSHLLVRFRDYVNEHVELGINGGDETVPYIAPSKLKNYWSEKRVDAILNGYRPPIPHSSDLIIKKHLQIFSILVYIDHPQEISWFCSNIKDRNDNHLPFDGVELPRNCPWTEEFLRYQWKFHPLVFTPDSIYKRTISPRMILPVTYDKQLSERRGGCHGAKLWKVQVHNACNSITPEVITPFTFNNCLAANSQKNEPVVFKVFEGTDADDLYTAETNVYSKLRSKDFKQITKNFACFSFQGKQKSIMVLEYAAGGSLLDFLRATALPESPDDFYLLWTRLLKLLDGLEILHNLYRPDGPLNWTLAGVHQDIQPANILVFPQKNQVSPFDVKFKLTDFGLAEIGRVSNFGGTMVTENRGNRMYIAPESYPNFSVQELVKTDLPPTTDIWALGAVFSDVLVWSINGESGREKYRQRRKEEISRQRHMKAADYDACFHDGVDRLSAVEDFHNLALQDTRVRDKISPYISHLILDKMLRLVVVRETAMSIRMRADRDMKELQNNMASPSVSPPTDRSLQQRPPEPRPPVKRPVTTPVPARPVLSPLTTTTPFQDLQPVPPGTILYRTSFQQSPVGIESPARGTSQEIPQPPERKVTVDMVYSILEKKDKLSSIVSSISTRADKLPDVMDLPGMEEARSKIRETRGRDQVAQIMVIDNFSSMSCHKQQVMKTARVVGYVAKVADDNGMELYAASEVAQNPLRCKNSSKIEKGIKEMKTVSGTCDMRRCLDMILDRVLVGDKVKPTGIYIYTDGIWELGADRVQFTIQRAIDHLIKCHQPSTTIMFQFIQFGRDSQGSKRLKYLDDECTKQYGGEE
ncbi:hypothetical protein SNK05_002799 [Fusarium graminearum]